MKTKRKILIMLAATSLLLVGCATGHHPTQWEYKVTLAPAPPNLNEVAVLERLQARQAWLNELGKDGWVLVSKDDGGAYYFNRPKR
jgi:lipoprotein NlpI